MEKRFLILGGTGTAGGKITDLLLEHTDSRITIAARNQDRIKKTVASFVEEYGKDRISGISIDAKDQNSLVSAFKNIDMVVVASGTANFADIVAQAALEANVDYLDIQYSSKKVETLKSYKSRIEQKNRLFITDAGFHPGLPAALVRLSTVKLTDVNSSIVYSVIKQDWRNLKISNSTKKEFVRELNDFEALFYSKGAWQKASMVSTKDFKKIDFGSPLGVKLCTPMNFEEMKNLPNVIPTLKETGFYIAGFNWFIDMLLMPLSMVWMKVFKNFGLKTIAKIMFRSLINTSEPPFQTVLQLEAKDSNNKKYNLRLFHEDGYWFTAIPVVACLKQYIDGILPQSGLYCMGNIVEPLRIINDMEKMGIKIKEF